MVQRNGIESMEGSGVGCGDERHGGEWSGMW